MSHGKPKFKHWEIESQIIAGRAYWPAMKEAQKQNKELYEVFDDGSKARRWAPAPPVSEKRMRMYRERKAAHEAQLRQNAARRSA